MTADVPPLYKTCWPVECTPKHYRYINPLGPTGISNILLPLLNIQTGGSTQISATAIKVQSIYINLQFITPPKKNKYFVDRKRPASLFQRHVATKVYIYIYNFNKITVSLWLTALGLFIFISSIKHGHQTGAYKECIKTAIFKTPLQLQLFLFRLTVVSTVVLSNASDLSQLANTEARIILLYCTREEARHILSEATRLKLTGE